VDDQPVGRRVAYWRKRRGMSQQFFADRLGKSKSWVDKVERGVRRLDRFSTIAEIAEELGIDVQALTGRDPVRRPESVNCIDQVEVAEIRAALERYDRISAFHVTAAVSPPLSELRKSVDHAWMTFQRSRYGVLARRLPQLIRDAQAADTATADAARSESTDRARGEAAYLLAEVYQIASSTLRKMGEHDLAWLAADRATMVCQHAGDELLAALATARVAGALAALGRMRPALEISVNTANQIAPREGLDATPQRLSVYGMVLLQGAMAAARLGDSATVRDLLAAAEEAAKQVGGDENFYWTSFGPTNVAFHRVAAEVELGDGARALQASDEIDPLELSAMLPERRASHLLDVARAYAQVGDLPRASETMVEADRLAPSEVRCRPVAHELASDLVRRTKGALAPGMLELVDHMGLAG
jgi:transcriptional regulator with XRE-family HTH domain